MSKNPASSTNTSERTSFASALIFILTQVYHFSFQQYNHCLHSDPFLYYITHLDTTTRGVLGSGRSKRRAPPSSHDFQAAGGQNASPRRIGYVPSSLAGPQPEASASLPFQPQSSAVILWCIHSGGSRWPGATSPLAGASWWFKGKKELPSIAHRWRLNRACRRMV
jgi:hypothetical protein